MFFSDMLWEVFIYISTNNKKKSKHVKYVKLEQGIILTLLYVWCYWPPWEGEDIRPWSRSFIDGSIHHFQVIQDISIIRSTQSWNNSRKLWDRDPWNLVLLVTNTYNRNILHQVAGLNVPSKLLTLTYLKCCWNQLVTKWQRCPCLGSYYLWGGQWCAFQLAGLSGTCT